MPEAIIPQLADHIDAKQETHHLQQDAPKGDECGIPGDGHAEAQAGLVALRSSIGHSVASARNRSVNSPYLSVVFRSLGQGGQLMNSCLSPGAGSRSTAGGRDAVCASAPDLGCDPRGDQRPEGSGDARAQLTVVAPTTPSRRAAHPGRRAFRPPSHRGHDGTRVDGPAVARPSGPSRRAGGASSRR